MMYSTYYSIVLLGILSRIQICFVLSENTDTGFSHKDDGNTFVVVEAKEAFTDSGMDLKRQLLPARKNLGIQNLVNRKKARRSEVIDKIRTASMVSFYIVAAKTTLAAISENMDVPDSLQQSLTSDQADIDKAVTAVQKAAGETVTGDLFGDFFTNIVTFALDIPINILQLDINIFRAFNCCADAITIMQEFLNALLRIRNMFENPGPTKSPTKKPVSGPVAPVPVAPVPVAPVPVPVAPSPTAPRPTAAVPVAVAVVPTAPVPVAPVPTAPVPVAPVPVAPVPVAPTPTAPRPTPPVPTLVAPTPGAIPVAPTTPIVPIVLAAPTPPRAPTPPGAPAAPRAPAFPAVPQAPAAPAPPAQPAAPAAPRAPSPTRP